MVLTMLLETALHINASSVADPRELYGSAWFFSFSASSREMESSVHNRVVTEDVITALSAVCLFFQSSLQF